MSRTLGKPGTSAARASVGRPRAAPGTATGAAREEILAAARTLFREQGFKGTSTREIAARAGLRQPSLFHYFKSKDEIFRAVALGAVQPVLAFAAAEAARRQAPEVALYRLIRFDTYHLCTNDNVLGSPFQFPELSRESQPEFWQLRDDLVHCYRRLLRQGARSKAFQIPHLEITTQLLFALGESTLNWYAADRGPAPAKVADAAARLALSAILSDPAQLDEIASLARAGQGFG